MARQRRSRGQWRRLVEGWARSGLTQQAHCDRHGISLGSLYRWREIFREEGVGGAPAEPVRLVPVELVGAGREEAKGLKTNGVIRSFLSASPEPLLELSY